MMIYKHNRILADQTTVERILNLDQTFSRASQTKFVRNRNRNNSDVWNIQRMAIYWSAMSAMLDFPVPNFRFDKENSKLFFHLITLTLTRK